MSNIGGEFSLRSVCPFLIDQAPDESQLFPKMIGDKLISFYETGTDAICSLILNGKGLKQDCSIWFPKHFCGQTLSRIKRILNQGDTFFTIRFYDNIEKILEFDFSTGDILIWVHFNRYSPIDTKVKKYLKSSQVFLLEDFVLAPFDINKMQGDGAVNSLRKVSPISLAVAYTGSCHQELKHVPDYNHIRKIAAWKKSVFEFSKDRELEGLFLSAFRQAESILELRTHCNAAPQEDIVLFHMINWQAILDKRRINYNVLADNIKISKDFLIEGEYQFFMMNTHLRENLRNKLFENRVYAPVHWIDSISSLANTQLSLPIDQRYNEHEMVSLATLVNKVLSSNEV